MRENCKIMKSSSEFLNIFFPQLRRDKQISMKYFITTSFIVFCLLNFVQCATRNFKLIKSDEVNIIICRGWEYVECAVKCRWYADQSMRQAETYQVDYFDEVCEKKMEESCFLVSLLRWEVFTLSNNLNTISKVLQTSAAVSLVF